MRDALQPTVRLSRDLQLNLIELPKADRLGLNTEALKAWVSFFEHWNDEDIMANIHYEPVQRAMESLKHLSAEAETRRLAFVRERAQRDEVAVRRMEREEGRAEGREEGREEGRVEGEAELILRLLARRCGALSTQQKSRILALSREQLDSLGDSLLDFTNIADLDTWLK
jgi:predicted transposase/invertase (TIGR01784 family)